MSLTVVQRFVKAADKHTTKKLLEEQLAPSGAPLDDRKGPSRTSGRAYRASQQHFLCYTDPNLGRPWKAIIEEVVKDDIMRKKKIMQQRNREALEERLKEDKAKRRVTGMPRHGAGVS